MSNRAKIITALLGTFALSFSFFLFVVFYIVGFDFSGRCSIYVGIKKRDVKMMKECIDQHPDSVNRVGAGGQSPLIRCSIVGFAEGVDLLLRSGADVTYSSPDKAGDIYMKTALHLAVGNKNYRCVQLLLEHGADRSAKDAQGLTPLDYVKSDKKMMELFETNKPK